MRELRWPRLWLGVWVVGWILAIVLSLVNPAGLPPPPGSDKLGHLLAYATLAAWAALIFRRGWSLSIAGVALVFLGVSMEFAQGAFTETRRAEALDAVANTIGVLLGLLLAYSRWPELLTRLERRMEFVISRARGR